MSDRELLEFAAKAAGIDAEFDSLSLGMWLKGARTPDNNRYWNPIVDDGDALRLAAKLYLWESIRLAHRDVSDTVDIYAATRSAIVRAAAAIGKNMT